MMKVIYESRDYLPDRVTARYVRRCVSGEYRFCEVGEDLRYDIRQGTLEPEEIPADVRDLADSRVGHYFGYVKYG